MVEQSFTALPTMKNLLDYIRKYPQRTKRLLGIDYPQFRQLLEQAQSLAFQARGAPSGRKKAKLSLD